MSEERRDAHIYAQLAESNRRNVSENLRLAIAVQSRVALLAPLIAAILAVAMIFLAAAAFEVFLRA